MEYFLNLIFELDSYTLFRLKLYFYNISNFLNRQKLFKDEILLNNSLKHHLALLPFYHTTIPTQGH